MAVYDMSPEELEAGFKTGEGGQAPPSLSQLSQPDGETFNAMTVRPAGKQPRKPKKGKATRSAPPVKPTFESAYEDPSTRQITPGTSPKKPGEAMGAYLQRIASEAESKVTGPRQYRAVGGVERASTTPSFNFKERPKLLEFTDSRIASEPVPAPGETFESFQARIKQEQLASKLKADAQFGMLDRPKKPGLGEKTLKGARKVVSMSPEEFESGFVETAQSIPETLGQAAEAFTQGLTDPLRQSAVIGRALGFDVAQGTVPFDYLKQKEISTEGLGTTLVSGLGNVASFGLASALGGPAGVSLLGAASNAGSVFEEVKAKGLSDEQAIKASIPAAFIGLLEGVGGLGRGVGKVLEGRVTQMFGEEFLQGFFSQMGNNINARIVSGYDPGRAIAQEVLESGLLEGLLGGMIPAAAALPGLVGKIPQKLVDAGVAQRSSVVGEGGTGQKLFINPLVDRDEWRKFLGRMRGSKEPQIPETGERPFAGQARYYPGDVSSGRMGSLFVSPQIAEQLGVAPHLGATVKTQALQEALSNAKNLDPDTITSIQSAIDHAVELEAAVPVISTESKFASRLATRHENLHAAQPFWDLGGSQELKDAHSYLERKYGDKRRLKGIRKRIQASKLFQTSYNIDSDPSRPWREDSNLANFLSTELPAYAATGDYRRMGLTKDEADSFLQMYLEDLASQGMLKRFSTLGRFTPEFRKMVDRALEQNPELESPMNFSRAAPVGAQSLASSQAPEEGPTAWENRALEMGIPLALTPETRSLYQAKADSLKERMLSLDPSSPEFKVAEKEWTRAANILFESEVFSQASSWADLQQMLLNKFQTQGGRMAEAKQKPSTREFIEEFGTPTAVGNLQDYRVRKPRNPSRSPFMEVPESFFRGIGEGGTYGLQVPLSYSSTMEKRIADTLPKEEAFAALEAFREVTEEAKARGLNSVALLPPGRLHTLLHETIHVGQQAALDLENPDTILPNWISDLHDPIWAINHPFVQRALETSFGRQVARGDSQRLAMELPAYIAAGQLDNFEGLSVGEAIEYVIDYLVNVAETRGLAALDRLGEVAMMRPATAEMFNFAVEDVYAKQTGKAPAYGAVRSSEPARGEGPATSPLPTRPTILDPGSSRTPELASSRADETLGSKTDPGLGSSEGATPAGLAEPSPTDPSTPGAGPASTIGITNLTVWEDDPLFRVGINYPYVKEMMADFMELLREGGVEYNPKIPPSIQLAVATANGGVRPARVEAKLKKHGMTWIDYTNAIVNDVSESGRHLQLYSQLDRAWTQLLKNDPELAKKTIPAKKLIQLVIKDLEKGLLGRSLWNRSGDTMRKMALSWVGTAASNAWATGFQLPLRAATSYSAGLLQAMNSGKGSILDRIQEGNKAGQREMQAAVEVALALKPRELYSTIRRRPTARSTGIEDIIGAVGKTFPEVESKLHALSSGLEVKGGSDLAIDLARTVLPEVTNPKEKALLKEKLDLLAKRQKFNESLAGRAYQKLDGFYEFFLQPNIWQEYFFRRPYFVGQLDAELGRRGYNLRQMIADGRIHEIPEEAVNSAIDAALEVTWAFDPKIKYQSTQNDPIAKAVESASHHLIKGLSDLGGPAAFIIEGFPKNIYNGIKFFYEYGPLGFLHPGAKMLSPSAKFDFQDYKRLSSATLGTALYFAAGALREAVGGEEWWQIKSGRKTKDGRPIYLDGRRIPALSTFLWLSDRTIRVLTGRASDIDFAAEAREQYLSMRRAGDIGSIVLEALNSTLQHWGEDSSSGDGVRQRATQAAGQQLALPLRPMKNLQALINQFSEQEALQRDRRDAGILGPSLDSLPWIRRRLPVAESLTQPQPFFPEEDPLTSPFGVTFRPAENWAGQELRRLGISPYKYLKRDPIPEIDRAQAVAFRDMLERYSASIQDPESSYHEKPTLQQKAYWESLIKDQQMTSRAEAIGLKAATPEEQRKRERKEQSKGRFDFQIGEEKRKERDK